MKSEYKNVKFQGQPPRIHESLTRKEICSIKQKSYNNAQFQSWNTIHHPVTPPKIETNNPSRLYFHLWRNVGRDWDILVASSFCRYFLRAKQFKKSSVPFQISTCSRTSCFKKQGTQVHQRTEGSFLQNKSFSGKRKAVPETGTFLTKKLSFLYCFIIKTAHFFLFSNYSSCKNCYYFYFYFFLLTVQNSHH